MELEDVLPDAEPGLGAAEASEDVAAERVGLVVLVGVAAERAVPEAADAGHGRRRSSCAAGAERVACVLLRSDP